MKSALIRELVVVQANLLDVRHVTATAEQVFVCLADEVNEVLAGSEFLIDV